MVASASKLTQSKTAKAWLGLGLGLGLGLALGLGFGLGLGLGLGAGLVTCVAMFVTSTYESGSSTGNESAKPPLTVSPKEGLA